MKQAGKHSRHHTVLTRLLHNRNSYRTSSILLQTTNHFVTVAPSPSFLPFVSLLPILRIPIRCCNQRRNKFFRKENDNSAADAVVIFVYTAATRTIDIPEDVVRLRVDPSVTSIPANAFYQRKKLAEVELCEGLVEIGAWSFAYCSITKIIIPNSLRRINHNAFESSLICPIRLHDGIESIGIYASNGCIFTNFRIPSLITVIPDGLLWDCRSTFSVEMSKDVTEIRYKAFYTCCCLRNVALPPNADVGDYIFDEAADLLQLFGSVAGIIRNLKHRFDRLPIHRIVYYQSYNQGVLHNLINSINMRSGQRRTLRSKLDPTGNQQDCLGMTPLHILACSSVHDLELYHLIVEKYPANLTTEDRWGALPLLYAFWGAAPAEIIEFLLENYQSLYPDHEFDWTMMVEIMGRCDTPKESIENLLRVKQMHFPEQPIDWVYLLDVIAEPSNRNFRGAHFQERMRFLFMCGMSSRVEALPFKVWRDHITTMIQTANLKYNRDNSVILRGIREKLAQFEDKLPKLKEATSILELALWNTKMNEKSHQDRASRCQKKIKTDESSTRQKCRLSCGADVVIRHVLPY